MFLKMIFKVGEGNVKQTVLQMLHHVRESNIILRYNFIILSLMGYYLIAYAEMMPPPPLI